MSSNGSQQTRVAGISLNDNATAGSHSMNIRNAVGTVGEGSKVVAGDYTEVRQFLSFMPPIKLFNVKFGQHNT